MSYDIALSRLTHDLQFTPLEVAPGAVQKYSLWFIPGADKVAQQIKINLLTLLGEWFLDETWGVPYLEEITIKNPRMSAVETILRTHIRDVPDVVSIDSFNMEWDRKLRVLSVTFECTTNLGPITDSIKLQMT